MSRGSGSFSPDKAASPGPGRRPQKSRRHTTYSQLFTHSHYLVGQLFCDPTVILSASRGFPAFPIKSLCLPAFPMSNMSHGTRRRMRHPRPSRQTPDRSLETKTKTRQDFIQAVPFTMFHDPARGRADIPPGGARSRYDPETGRNGGPCSGSSMCPPFPYLKPIISGQDTESTF